MIPTPRFLRPRRFPAAWCALAPALLAALAGPVRGAEPLKRFGEGLTLVYTERDRALADRLWPALLADREALMARLELYPEGTLRVELTPTVEAFLAAGGFAGALGVYDPYRRTIVLRSPRTDPAGGWDVRGVARHELVHGLLHLAINQPIPRWLNEGLAILMADELSFLDDSRLTMQAVLGHLIPLPLLMAGFPAGEGPRTQAYAQAASFARFLLGRGGMPGVRLLLATLAEGHDAGTAFRTAYGTSLAELEEQWRQGLARRFSVFTLITTSSVLGGVGVPLLLVALVRRAVQRRRKLAEWAGQERDEAAPLGPEPRFRWRRPAAAPGPRTRHGRGRFTSWRPLGYARDVSGAGGGPAAPEPSFSAKGAAMADAPRSGTFVYFEVTTGDKPAAEGFYTRLLGWRAESMDMGAAGQYTMFYNGDTPVGGVVTLPDGPEWAGISPHWRPYLAVDDLEASVAQALALGATQLVPISPVPGMGRYAVFRDPAGAVVGLFQAGT